MKISVYCLVFNHEKYLYDALNGIVRQKTSFAYEVIVHDDASTDNSRKIIESFARNYPEIIKPVYQQENQHSKGVNIFMTYILPEIKGEYVAVCEGDDYWTSSYKLQKQADFLDQHPEYTACVHNTIVKDMRTNKEKEMYAHKKDEDILFADAVQSGGSSFHTSSLMYRVKYAKNRPEFFKKAKGFGDYPLAILLTLSGRVWFFNETMSVYRKGTELSWTKHHNQDMHKNALVHENIAEMLMEVNKYTEFKYDKMLQQLILKNKYYFLLCEERYPELRKQPYRNIFFSMPVSHRCKVFCRQYFNGLYHWYLRIRT